MVLQGDGLTWFAQRTPHEFAQRTPHGHMVGFRGSKFDDQEGGKVTWSLTSGWSWWDF